MAQMALTQDLELCRKILLRTEEVLASDGPKGPSNYKFSGYNNDKVGYNVEALHHEGFIEARIPSERIGQWACWPVGLLSKGVEFLTAARCEDAWTKALRLVDEREKTPTIKMLTHYLVDVVGKEVTV